MGPHDYNNLKFILSQDIVMLRNWWDALTDDDRLYATEILKSYEKELDADPNAFLKVYDMINDEEDVSEAREYLRKFQL